jgi:hypothetical protein
MLRKSILAAVAALTFVAGIATAQAAPLAPASAVELKAEATQVHFGPRVVCTYHYHGFQTVKRCRVALFERHHHHDFGHHHGHHGHRGHHRHH